MQITRSAIYYYKEYKVQLATNLEEADRLLRLNCYRFVVIDLNVPATGPVAASIANRGHLHQRFSGLCAAELARSMGHRRRQVVVYSVHDSEEVRKESERIGFTYILKGRPREFKAEIDSILSYDPLENRDQQSGRSDN